MSEDTKTYILEDANGNKRKVTVPSSWKVTFGPLIPGSRDGGRGTLALRFYEGKDQQRAVFTDIASFRDDSIPIEERVTKTKRQNLMKHTKDGDRVVGVEARIVEWVNPDEETGEPDEEFLQIQDMS